ncbi:glucans biosynthesis glucosyltransferase MdoH [Devosia sp. 2618]|uniref:glucans biosynthesis glucosyltransferase MdoH n=1 Tax=Devosia sp. 2618 TaxID=3156454 RepID=UPI0033923223
MHPFIVRSALLFCTLALSLLGGYLFLRFTGEGGLTALDLVRTALVVFSGFWLVWGAAAAMIGVLVPARRILAHGTSKPVGMTAILVPIYNEDPVQTFSRIAAMNRGLVALGVEDRFHIAVLSDSNSSEAAALEELWFQRLASEPEIHNRIFYRRREKNVGKKAGNVEDFISRSGGAYDYALILDADSLMEGNTIAELARRMDADQTLGLLQTVPKIIHARTLFGRCMQFSSNYLSPSFARGAALMQGYEGPYWGHNAIIRMNAFAASCGLPVLTGKPPYGGHILSHDYVEAALLARAGWKVQVDPALEGSYEEGPENLLEYAKRDRRWCQGNMQHRRLVMAPGLKFWSRFTFVQGIMAYMAAPLWLALLFASISAAVFPDQPPVLAGFTMSDISIWTLGFAVIAVLILPKLMIFLRGIVDGQNKAAGGNCVALASMIGEIVFSTVLAPAMLLLQSRAVGQVLLGLDGGWPATSRAQGYVPLRDAFRATWWIVALGLFSLGLTAVMAPSIVVWVAPTMLPAVLAPLLIVGSSRIYPWLKAWLFVTQPERAPSSVISEYQAVMASWIAQGAPEQIDASSVINEHVTA